MQQQFLDRILKCVDCDTDFIFAAGEQLFFFDKQFKNDPKRCKPCKSRRSGLAAVANGTGMPAAGLSRTETRTVCSECAEETTVPFKPTQGRPVLCRSCFGQRNTARMPLPLAALPLAALPLAALPLALTELSIEADGAMLSHDAAVLAAASITGAHAHSSVATEADLRLIAAMESAESSATAEETTVEMIAQMPLEVLHPELTGTELVALSAELAQA